MGVTWKSKPTFTAPASLGARLGKQLKGLLPLMVPSDKGFAESLVKYAEKNGKLSDKQLPFAQKLVQEYSQNIQNSPVAPPQYPGGTPVDKSATTMLPSYYPSIVKLFEAGGSKLKAPAIVMDLYGQPIELKKSKNGIKITNGVGYGKVGSVWFGLIDHNGQFAPSAKLQERDVAVLADFLEEFNADPFGMAGKYGKKWGKCCFCNKALTDEQSVKNGYGPVCAKNWGLKK